MYMILTCFLTFKWIKLSHFLITPVNRFQWRILELIFATVFTYLPYKKMSTLKSKPIILNLPISIQIDFIIHTLPRFNLKYTIRDKGHVTRRIDYCLWSPLNRRTFYSTRLLFVANVLPAIKQCVVPYT